MLASKFTNRRKYGKEGKKEMRGVFGRTMRIGLEERKKLKQARAGQKVGISRSKKISSWHAGEQHQVGLPHGKRQLSQEEYAEVKRRKKENDLLRKQWPKILVNELGKRSSLSLESDRTPLFVGDVQSLLLFSLLGNGSPVVPRWTIFKNANKISNVVMVHIEGVGLSDMKQETHTLSEGRTAGTSADNIGKEALKGGHSAVSERRSVTGETEVSTGRVANKFSSSGGLPAWLKNSLPRTSQFMNHSLEVVAPSVDDGCAVVEMLQLKMEKQATIPEMEEDIKKHIADDVITKKTKAAGSFFRILSTIPSNPNDKVHPNDSYSRLKLLLRPGELAKHNYPLPIPGYHGGSNKEFAFTSDDYKEVTSCSPMFGVDCEMCLTTIHKLELASISVVNEKLETMYHTLVLPYNPVTNFLTKYSGITPAMLLHVTKRLEHVQEDLRKLLPPDAILVGHSLQSDLGVMKMMHPYVIDSALAYNLTGRHHRSSSLKLLSEMFLNEKIQTSQTTGHDPTEDAIASLKLVQLKLKHDEIYGNLLMGWEVPCGSLGAWQEQLEHEAIRDSQEDTKELKPEKNSKLLEGDAIGPFNQNARYIFQTMSSSNIAIVTTSQCFNNYPGVLSSLANMPTVEVLKGNKQVSLRARDFIPKSDLTYVHLEMGKKLSQCPNEATRQRQLSKLDKRLRRIHLAADPKSVHIYFFSGSSLDVPLSKRSNGFVLVGLKDIPFNT